MFFMLSFRNAGLSIFLVALAGSLLFCPPGSAADSDEASSQNPSSTTLTTADTLDTLTIKPLYQFSEQDLDLYLRHLRSIEPDLAKRIIHLGRKNIGQPYEIFLLGEAPFENYDNHPLYCLAKSDCVTFSEHTFAMALGYDWPSFFAFLQRIRYKNGEIGYVTRNHYTIPQWDQENALWLIEDITKDIAKEKTRSMTSSTDFKNFFSRWNIGQDMKDIVVTTEYIPQEHIPQILDKLKDADFVNVIRGKTEPDHCGHVGLIAIGENGSVNFLHSSEPVVKEEPLLDYMKAQLKKNEKAGEKDNLFFGFKFFRLRTDAVERLRAMDGLAAPRVTGPGGLLTSRLSYPGWVEPRAPLSPEESAAVAKLGLDSDRIALLKARPLHEFTENDLDLYLGWLHEAQPALPLRVRHLARKAIGMPYQIYLLGEFPFEIYDDAPLYTLNKGDCVVFSEHIYAMALSRSWQEFFVFLQRLRYQNGEIGILTRNHFTIPEWDAGNSWLLEDKSRDLAGDQALVLTDRTRHSPFFKERYGIVVDMPDITIETNVVPSEMIPSILPQLKTGDFVNIIFASGKSCWASHVGLIIVAEDGVVNFLHATRPSVREEPLLDYDARQNADNIKRKAEGKATFIGFKFLRLRSDPLAELRKIDGPEAPVVKAPLGVTLGPGRRWTPEEE